MHRVDLNISVLSDNGVIHRIVDRDPTVVGSADSSLTLSQFVAHTLLIVGLLDRRWLELRGAVIGLFGNPHRGHAHPRLLEFAHLQLLARAIQRDA